MTQGRKLDKLNRVLIRYRTLPPDLTTRIASLRSTLDGVYPQSMTEWVNAFQRNATPEAEVIWWERQTRCYIEYSRSQELDGGQRQAAFTVIMKLALGCGGVTEHLATLPTNALHDIVKSILRNEPLGHVPMCQAIRS